MTGRYELRIISKRPTPDDDPRMQCNSRGDAMRKAEAFLRQARDQTSAVHHDTYKGDVRTASERIFPAR